MLICMDRNLKVYSSLTWLQNSRFYVIESAREAKNRIQGFNGSCIAVNRSLMNTSDMK